MMACLHQKEDLTAPAAVKQYYLTTLRSVDSIMTTFRTKLVRDTSTEELQRIFKQARLIYKQTEFLTEYKAANFAKLINGAAVPEIEEEDNQELTINPEGFQVIETFIFPSFHENSRDTLISLTEDLLKAFRLLEKQINKDTLSDSLLFIALRKEIFRVTTLGITTYDADLSGNAIAECSAVMKSMRTVIDIYKHRIDKVDPALHQQLKEYLDNSIFYLDKNREIDSFDRIAFIIRYANPVSGLLRRTSFALDIDISGSASAVNSTADNLFVKDAFNPRFFIFGEEEYPSQDKQLLGEYLFFDPILSANNQRSCASCHRPENGFTDGLRKSPTLNGRSTVKRNALTLLNAGLQPVFFYDGRATYLEDQVNDVLSSVDEMHGSASRAVALLSLSPEYETLFKKAFPNTDKPITPYHLQNAIATYIRSLIRLNSPFDLYMRGDYSQLNSHEVHGFNLFMGKAKCATCHFAPLFNGAFPPDYSMSEYEVIGVPAVINAKAIDEDKGRYELHPAMQNLYAFRTPTLRNISLTAPYMHNGIYATLEQVIDFYNKGGAFGLGINLSNQTLPMRGLHLTEEEQQDIVAFLKTLTDTSNTRFVPISLPKLSAAEKRVATY